MITRADDQSFSTEYTVTEVSRRLHIPKEIDDQIVDLARKEGKHPTEIITHLVEEAIARGL